MQGKGNCSRGKAPLWVLVMEEYWREENEFTRKEKFWSHDKISREENQFARKEKRSLWAGLLLLLCAFMYE
jgi:hypothetical protein